MMMLGAFAPNIIIIAGNEKEKNEKNEKRPSPGKPGTVSFLCARHHVKQCDAGILFHSKKQYL